MVKMKKDIRIAYIWTEIGAHGFPDMKQTLTAVPVGEGVNNLET
jgi:hypothetical protein